MTCGQRCMVAQEENPSERTVEVRVNPYYDILQFSCNAKSRLSVTKGRPGTTNNNNNLMKLLIVFP